ncbi:MAG: IS630 family transposase, partial [Tannerella sp.]|nr:IS630 family transposase [Tannerella sp.]
MLELKFTEEDMQALQYERYNHPHPRVMLKMEVVCL